LTALLNDDDEEFEIEPAETDRSADPTTSPKPSKEDITCTGKVTCKN
jgi:hypothetical protein